MDINTQLLLVGKLFLLMSIGLVLRKRSIILDSGKTLLTDLVIDLILPCSIAKSFLVQLTQERLIQTGIIFLLSAGIQVTSYLLGIVAYRKCRREHQIVMQYATVCSNSGILGTPIAEGIFGSEGTLLAAVFLIPIRIVMWTLGLSYFEKKNGRFSLKRVVTHPCIMAVGIGLALMVTQIQLPQLLMECLSTLGGCNTALSMILVGSIIADMQPRLLVHPDTIYYALIRLIGLPLAVLLACNVLKVDLLVRNVSVILTAMPAGATTSILALKYGEDAQFASACTALTTIFSLFAVPFWCSMLLYGYAD